MLHIRIYRSWLLMKFRGHDSINSKENIQAGCRNGSRIFSCWCVDKISLNYGVDTYLSFIITNHYLPACLWAQIDPVKFNDHSLDASCKLRWTSISEIDSSVSNIRERLSCRKHVHHYPSSKYASRCWAKKKWLHVLWDEPFPEVRMNRVESMKT